MDDNRYDRCIICEKECASQIDVIECENKHKERYDRHYEEYITKLYQDRLKVAAENPEQQKLCRG